MSEKQTAIEAVQAADPAASNIVATTSQSGTSWGWAFEIDHAGELTSDTLALILRSVAALDPQPVDISLFFFVPGTDEAIDIVPVATELDVPWNRVGSGGSWFTGQLGEIAR